MVFFDSKIIVKIKKKKFSKKMTKILKITKKSVLKASFRYLANHIKITIIFTK